MSSASISSKRHAFSARAAPRCTSGSARGTSRPRRTVGGVTSPPRNCNGTWPRVADTLSKDGPKDRETRLALVGHMRFMQGNGSGCWAGARTIGETTYQNKATVLKHRAEAIRDGWLVLAPEGKSKHHGELWASVPDGVKIEEKYLAAAVLPDRTGCPTASDLTPDNSISLKEGSENEKARSFARSRERRLRLWLATYALGKKLSSRHRLPGTSGARLVTIRGISGSDPGCGRGVTQGFRERRQVSARELSRDGQRRELERQQD